MDSDLKNLPPGDPKLIDSIVNQLKSQGIFDEFRRDCLADVDTKPAYQNLQHRVETFANDYLKNTQWRPDLNKNQLRDGLRKQITESGLLTIGVDRIIDQIVNPKIIKIFLPKITEIVHKLLGIDMGSSQNSASCVGPVSNGEGSQASTKPVTGMNSSFENKSAFSKDSIMSEGQPMHINKTDIKQEVDKAKDKLLAASLVQDIKSNSDLSHSSPESSFHKEVETKKDKSGGNKGDSKVGTVRPESGKKIEQANKGVSDDKAKLKPVKKAETKPEYKLKPGSNEKTKSSDFKVKSEKPGKKDVTPTKSKGSDNKSQKIDDIHKESSIDNKDKKQTMEKKPSSIKVSESQTKSKSEEHKNKPETHRQDDANAQRAKKIESKEKEDSKLHKFLQKSKSFEDKDEGKPKLEKNISERGKEDASKRCSNSDSIKTDKSKDEKSKSDCGKLNKTSELSKGDYRPKTDKLKASVEKKPESSKHKLLEKSDRPQESKVKSLERSKSSECVSRHEDTRVDTKSCDKKSSSSVSCKKVKEFEKGLQEKHKSSSYEVKPKELEGMGSSKLKPTNVSRMPSSSTKEDKCKTKKESDREIAKVKSDERSHEFSSSTKAFTYSDKNDEKCTDLKYEDNKPHSYITEDKSLDSEQNIQSKSVVSKHGSQTRFKKHDSGKDKLGKRKISEASSASEDFSVMRKQKSDQNSSSGSFYSEDCSKDSSNDKRSSAAVGNIADDDLSDVTVSSVHTSDLSDFDDRITLSESDSEQEENVSSKKSSSNESQNKVIAKDRDSSTVTSHKRDTSTKCETFVNTKQKIDVTEREPRRELRRQRKLNPRYASDDFKSIFNTGKEKSYHGHPLDYTIEDISKNADVVDTNLRGRRFTGSSIATDDNELPTSPLSDVSEFEEPTKNKRSEKNKWISPSESSDGDHSSHDRRSNISESIDGPDALPKAYSQQPSTSKRGKIERYQSSPTDITITSPRNDGYHRRDFTSDLPPSQKRAPRSDNQRYNDTDLYKPRPVFSSSRRRGASPTRSNYATGFKDSEEMSQTRHNTTLEQLTVRGRTNKTLQEVSSVPHCGTKRSSEHLHHSTAQKRRR